MSEPNGPRVALTFDAEHPDRSLCPPGTAERILDTLRDASVRATFFIQSRWATATPGTARRIADEGHLVGHHSKFHARMPLLSDEGLRADVREGEEEIREITGTDPRPWFRCPFGDGRDDLRVLSALEELGYRNVHWDVEAEDWEEWQTGAGVRDRVVDGVRARGGADTVVVLHTWPGPTTEALPLILDGLEGARFVALDELGEVP
ncbi:MAG: polysaccharide deacetylase family protein [Actinobacteria bacterium]|nr:polysaccharide deacetylase family protein [Actinomycetota bacterium]